MQYKQEVGDNLNTWVLNLLPEVGALSCLVAIGFVRVEIYIFSNCNGCQSWESHGRPATSLVWWSLGLAQVEINVLNLSSDLKRTPY